MDVVWLKRDVRLRDHEPFAMASSSGRDFLVLYMYEPDQLFHETVHSSHLAFVNEGLAELDKRLRKLSSRKESHIITRQGEATDILSSLHSEAKIKRLLSHEESGHNASYDRDKRVKKWCHENGVSWVETPQATVVRGLSLRDPSWRDVCSLQVDSFLAVTPNADPFGGDIAAKKALSRLVSPHSDGFLSAEQLGLPIEIVCDRPERQHGGETHALELLSTFLDSRGQKYAGKGVISSPNSAWEQCSRLSPYYSWGHISVRTVIHEVKAKQASAKGIWARSLEAYLERLEWRRTRIQDFEMRCWMEHRSVFQPWEHLRDGFTFMFGSPKLLGQMTEQQRLAAFKEGKTGYPMVDACMRCLLHTGWLNFRMRCMLVSFATFNLWLDWRTIQGHLARCFLDYEPGIHYVQLQLHAGTFGGMCHCYGITKQAKDQDPEGIFIRRYVPELANVSNEFIHEPWKLPERPSSRTGGRRWASRYPSPIVNEKLTAEASRKVIEEAQRQQYDNSAEGEDDDSDEHLLQLALMASRGDLQHGDGLHRDQKLQEELDRALQEAEDTELEQAIRASLA
jgi:deoxyribodipyrimidine photo-lyase